MSNSSFLSCHRSPVTRQLDGSVRGLIAPHLRWKNPNRNKKTSENQTRRIFSSRRVVDYRSFMWCCLIRPVPASRGALSAWARGDGAVSSRDRFTELGRRLPCILPIKHAAAEMSGRRVLRVSKGVTNADPAACSQRSGTPSAQLTARLRSRWGFILRHKTVVYAGLAGLPRKSRPVLVPLVSVLQAHHTVRYMKAVVSCWPGED